MPKKLLNCMMRSYGIGRSPDSQLLIVDGVLRLSDGASWLWVSPLFWISKASKWRRWSCAFVRGFLAGLRGDRRAVSMWFSLMPLSVAASTDS